MLQIYAIYAAMLKIIIEELINIKMDFFSLLTV